MRARWEPAPARPPTGFVVTLDVPTRDQVDTAMTDLLRRGSRPAVGSSDSWPRTPDGLPVCPRHQVPRRPREPQGDTWYAHQVPDPRTGARRAAAQAREQDFAAPLTAASAPGWGGRVGLALALVLLLL